MCSYLVNTSTHTYDSPCSTYQYTIFPINDQKSACLIQLLLYFVVNQPSAPVHPAFYTTSSGGYNIEIEPRDTYFPDDTMNGGSGASMNEQNLTYSFIIKLYSPNTNKTSYCPVVSTCIVLSRCKFLLM